MKHHNFLIIILLTSFVKSQEDDLVNECVNEITEFIESTHNFSAPMDSRDFLKNATPGWEYFGEYDFIIVGAGAGGSAVANRLSEIPDWKILVLEAGGPGNNITDMPALTYLLTSTNFDWGYRTTQQKNMCLDTENGTCTYQAGKALGGSTTINAMFYARGNKLDYDRWEALGNPDWSYENVLPYFIKAENATLPGSDPKYHGKSGPIHVQYNQHSSKTRDIFLEGNLELGNKIVEYDGADQFGFSKMQTNLMNEKRCSAEKGYLNPIKGKPDVTILSGALVLKILIDKDDKEARGVQFIHNGVFYNATTKKEVILCAGTLRSPQLLMLSGIGPADELQKHNIPLILELPVGRRFLDDLFFYMTITTNISASHANLTESVEQYLKGEGRLTTSGQVLEVGFLTTNTTENSVPDMTITYRDSNLEAVYIHTSETEIINVVLMPLHTRSVGTVTLKSASPFDYPLIDPNYYSDPIDIELLIAGIKYTTALSKTEAMKKVNGSLSVEPVPSCDHYEFMTDEYWRCAVKIMTIPGVHAISSCKMGPTTDPEAVVDANLKVHGIDKLRVIDASVIPLHVSAPPMVPTFMVGEKGADIIKKCYEKL